jgi:DnaJ domain
MQQGLVERFRLLREALELVDPHTYDDATESDREVVDIHVSTVNVVGAAESDGETAVYDDLYTLLGLTRSTDVTVDEIRAAFRKVSRLFHPDRHSTDSHADAEDRKKKFLAVSDAKDILTCATLRQIYDLGGMPAVALHRAAADPAEIDAVPVDVSLVSMSYEEEIIEGNRGLIILCGFI